MTRLEAHYSARDIEARILAAIRAAGLNPEQRLSHQELGAPDHFHTGGLSASLELLELAQSRAEEQVLVVGAGLGGGPTSDQLGRITIEQNVSVCVLAATTHSITRLGRSTGRGADLGRTL